MVGPQAGASARRAFAVIAGDLAGNTIQSPAHGLTTNDRVIFWPTIGQPAAAATRPTSGPDRPTSGASGCASAFFVAGFGRSVEGGRAVAGLTAGGRRQRCADQRKDEDMAHPQIVFAPLGVVNTQRRDALGEPSAGFWRSDSGVRIAVARRHGC